MKRYIFVSCKTCQKGWDKRADSLKSWHGMCKSCASSAKLSSPEAKNALRVRARKQALAQGGIPNARKFTVGSTSGSKNIKWKGGKPECLDCNVKLGSYKAIRCLGCYAKKQIGRIATPEQKARMRANIPRGSRHHNWRGGTSGEDLLLRMSAEYNDWRKAVFERDNYTCLECGARSAVGQRVTLNADHIYPFADCPERRLDIDNGRTLCVDCHRKTDTYGWKLVNSRKYVSDGANWIIVANN